MILKEFKLRTFVNNARIKRKTGMRSFFRKMIKINQRIALKMYKLDGNEGTIVLLRRDGNKSFSL